MKRFLSVLFSLALCLPGFAQTSWVKGSLIGITGSTNTAAIRFTPNTNSSFVGGSLSIGIATSYTATNGVFTNQITAGLYDFSSGPYHRRIAVPGNGSTNDIAQLSYDGLPINYNPAAITNAIDVALTSLIDGQQLLYFATGKYWSNATPAAVGASKVFSPFFHTNGSNQIEPTAGDALASFTNNLATTNFVNGITNGLATITYVGTITNGLATITYVTTITNGLATITFVQAITNGLATITYANSLTNSLATTNQVNAKQNGSAALTNVAGATGTPSGSTFLRGDYVWAAPAGTAANYDGTFFLTNGTAQIAPTNAPTFASVTATGAGFTGNGAGLTNLNYSQPVFVFIGDSQTSDNSTPGTNGWPFVLMSEPNFLYKGSEVNMAYSGNTLSNEVASRSGRWDRVSPHSGQTNLYGFVMAGFNDIKNGYGITVTTNNATNIWGYIRASGAKVVAMTVFGDESSSALNLVRTNYNTFVRGNSQLYDVLIDTDALVTNNATQLFDGIHPSAATVQLIADTINTNSVLTNIVAFHRQGLSVQGLMTLNPAPNNIFALQFGNGTLGSAAIRAPLEVRSQDNYSSNILIRVDSANVLEGVDIGYQFIRQFGTGALLSISNSAGARIDFQQSGNLTLTAPLTQIPGYMDTIISKGITLDSITVAPSLPYSTTLSFNEGGTNRWLMQSGDGAPGDSGNLVFERHSSTGAFVDRAFVIAANGVGTFLSHFIINGLVITPNQANSRVLVTDGSGNHQESTVTSATLLTFTPTNTVNILKTNLDNVTVTNLATLSGNATIGGTLGVTGAQTNSSNITINGADLFITNNGAGFVQVRLRPFGGTTDEGRLRFDGTNLFWNIGGMVGGPYDVFGVGTNGAFSFYKTNASVTSSGVFTGNGNGLTNLAITAGANMFVTQSTSGLIIASSGGGGSQSPLTADVNGALFSITNLAQIKATNLVAISTNNDNAAAGYLGEYVESLVASGAAKSLVTATGTNVTSIILTAGDWDVSGNINFSASSATVTGTSGGITTTTLTVPVDGSEVYSGVQVTILSETDSVTLPRKRMSLAATTTVYLVGKCTFSAGTVTAFGSLTARRVR